MESKSNHLNLIQTNDVQKRVSQFRNNFDKYRQGKNNKTVTATPDLQSALFKAAKVGNVNLMQEFISHGADPFTLDEHGFDSISYAMEADPIKTGNMLLKLISETMQADED